MCLFRLLLKVPMHWAHLMELRSMFQRGSAACAKQSLPKPSGDNEVSSSVIYPQMIEVSQVTVVIENKMEPRHVEPCRPATGSYILFPAQLASSVALSVLVLYCHITVTRTKCEWYYSGIIALVYRLSAVHCQMTRYSQRVPGYLTRYSVSAKKISFDKKISQSDCVFQIRLGLEENDSPLWRPNWRIIQNMALKYVLFF